MAQVIVTAIVLPFGFLARYTRLYARWMLPGVSGAVAVLALLWFVDRASGLSLIPL